MSLSSFFLIALVILGTFIAIIVFWLLFLFHSNKKREEQFQQENLYQVTDPWGTLMEPEEIFELHQEAFVYNNFDALEKLAAEYQAGAVDYWKKKNPDVIPLIAQAVKKLADLAESGQAPREPELEDFYYIGLLYEQGFEYEPDLEKALLYFKKALQTKNCWSHNQQRNKYLRPLVERKIRQIEGFIAQQYLNAPN